MKKFTKVEPWITQTVGDRFKRTVIIKKFKTEDGAQHEFTTNGEEGRRSGAMIAITPDKQVVISYQFRGGPERWMYELPGGGINHGEDPRVGIIRELKEETGYVSDNVEFLGTSCRDSLSNTVFYYYLALDCVMSQSGSELDMEEQEQGAEVHLITIDELINNAKNDQMTDPHAVLMAYEKLKEMM
jgi:ADP-ribose pyrophosphatase